MKLDKALAQLTDSGVEEIITLPAPGLHKVVSDSEANIARATKERDENPEYQKAKQACKDLSIGLSNVKKYQKAKAFLALSLLGEMDGQTMSEEDEVSLRIARDRIASGKRAAS